MNRRTFLGVTLMAIESLYADEQNKMPAMFCAHGSPMNMLSNNAYTKAMHTLATKLQKPKAVIMISAHWVTNGLFVSTATNQETIHDFYGFPKPLYDIRYPAHGDPSLANRIIKELSNLGAKADAKRGLDHGGWAVMKFLFPNADVPVFQMSLNKHFTPREHFELGARLVHLRNEGVMIIGSGDIVHNLWETDADTNATTAKWAIEFESKIKTALLKKDYNTLINYLNIGEAARLSCPTSEHYLPLLYVAGATQNEQLGFYYEGFENATISLSCFGTNL
jgi:4,5-DOPA dioxygenase extradiol